MSYAHYDRLSALDATFLDIESASVHMHVGAVGIFGGRALRKAGGGLDVERIRALAEPALRQNARFRQRLERIPLFGHRVWVDDPGFQLDYHLRHTALPAPGDERQLKRLAGRLFSQKLDPSRPLWEMWLVEGLEGGRFAVITKVHHCMIDGVSGADLLAGFLVASLEPGAQGGRRTRGAAGAAAPRWVPRPAPPAARLFADELARRTAFPLRAAAAGTRLLREPVRALAEARHAAGAMGSLFVAGLGSASSTPLNGDVGPYRRFDWTELELGAVREVKERFGATVNDVVLAVVSGAMRRFLARRGLPVDELDFRAMLPVNVRRPAQQRALGNRVASLVARLPVDERRPELRMARVVEATRRLKRSDLVEGGELLEELSDLAFPGLVAQITRLAAGTRAYNVVVTNVPGPQLRVALLGAPMERVYPLVPLFSNQGLGIALFSYDGTLYWGFNADWDAVPDLHDLVAFVQEEFEALRKLEGARR